MFKRFVLPLLLLPALTACQPSISSYFAPTAAVINGVKIPEASLSVEMRRTLRNPSFAPQFQGPQGEQNILDAKRAILTQLIRRQIIGQQARRLGIAAKDSEVNAQVARLKGRFSSEAAFRAEMRRQLFTFPEVVDFLRFQILQQKVSDVVAKPTKPSEQDVRAVYNRNKATYDDMVHAAHILVCGHFDAASRQCNFTPDDQTLANQIRDRARAGEDFKKLAAQYSVDTSNKDSGGDLGWFGRNQMVPEFEQAAYALQPGQISDPVKTQFGLHVIKLIAKGETFEDARASIEQQMGGSTGQQAFETWLSSQLRKAHVRINPKLGHFDPSTLQVVPPASPAKQPKVPGL
jgi:foldase protein PrsA